MKLEELEERLEGTHDLNDVTDCRAIITMLLRDLEAANKREEWARTHLRAFAFMVRDGKPNIVEKADAIIAGVKSGDVDVISVLKAMSAEMDRAEEMSDTYITNDVFKEVWGDLDIDSRGSSVLGEMILRFKKLTGQEVPSDD